MRPVLIAFVLLAAACTGDSPETAADLHQEAHDLELMTVPPVEPVAPDPVQATAPDAGPVPAGSDGTVAVIGEHGHLGSLTDASVDDTWVKWQAHASLDGSTAVMTLQDATARTIHDTLLSWVSLPDAVETDRLQLPEFAAELHAVSRDGALVALTNFADPVQPGQIAGAKSHTTLRIVDRDGVRYETDLAGNFVAEAFGRTIGPDGLPEQVFLLEHIPADAPTFYRVRVLSTATGEVSLPLNIRDKTQQVDERMSGLSRSQVIADEHGLLFTLYRGTIDGTPDGEPYAFVHTLDLANGVWCLFLDPELELDTLPGSIAVGGDRLYVASANGKVGSIEIPSISDITRNPEMDRVVQAGRANDEPPVLLADSDGVWVGLDDGASRLVRFDTAGFAEPPKALPSDGPTALATGPSSEIVAAGDGWSTLGDPGLPDWFGAPTALYLG